MINISEEKVYERWDTLPPSLKQALVSEVNSDFIWKTCGSEHVPDEKIYNVGRAVSHVLLGFIHPGDLAQEVKDDSKLNLQVANSIASSINERIFKPLSSDLEKIYEPPSALAVKPIEIKPFGSASFDAARDKQGKPTAQIPAPASASGMNMASPFQIKLTETLSPKSEIKPGVPLPPVIPKPETRTSEPPPIMIHEEPSVSPLKSAREFNIDIPQPKFSEIKLNVPPRPAVLEFGVSQPSVVKPAPTRPVNAPALFNQPQMPQPQITQSIPPKMNISVPRPIEVPKPPTATNINRNAPASPASPRRVGAGPEQKRDEQIFRPTRPTEINVTRVTQPPPSQTPQQSRSQPVRPESPQVKDGSAPLTTGGKVKVVHYSEFTTQPGKPSSTPKPTTPPTPPIAPKPPIPPAPPK